MKLPSVVTDRSLSTRTSMRPNFFDRGGDGLLGLLFAGDLERQEREPFTRGLTDACPRDEPNLAHVVLLVADRPQEDASEGDDGLDAQLGMGC